MKLRISVTKEILEKSKTCNGDTSNCAIARAVRSIFPMARVWDSIAPFGINNGEFLLWHLKKPKDNYISLPDEAKVFIDNFDKNISFEQRANLAPFSFEVDVPDEVINRINIDEIEILLQNHPTLALVS